MTPSDRDLALLCHRDGKPVMIELYERPSRSVPTWHWTQLRFKTTDGELIAVGEPTPLEMN